MVVAVGCGLQTRPCISYHILSHQFTVHISHGMNTFPVSFYLHAIAIGVAGGIGSPINHRGCLPVYMVGTVHVESVGRLLPQGEQSLVVDGTYFVDLSIAAVRLYTARILM